MNLDDAINANRQAAQRFLATARAVASAKWSTPIAPGKWSPAQIVDHVAISTEVALRAIKEDKTVGSFPRLLRGIPRAMVFNKTLKAGQFPSGMRGPKIFAPSGEHFAFEKSKERLERAVEQLESHVRTMAKSGKESFEHGFFGKLSVADYVRFNGLHSEHHEKQLPRA
jgi:hypothetical protein